MIRIAITAEAFEAIGRQLPMVLWQAVALELGFEYIKRLDNLRLECLKRFYERWSVTDLYEGGKLKFPIHGTFGGVRSCARYWRQ